ncbi:MAG TPA: hypothetical protein VF226_04785 [Hyphomicrobiaceae bacterium]
MANGRPQTLLEGFRQTFRAPFGSAGLGQFLPQRLPVTQLLQQAGINVPAPFQGLSAEQIADIAQAARALEPFQPARSPLQNPGELVDFVISLWRSDNQLRFNAGQPQRAFFQFLEEEGFRPDIRQMFTVLFDPQRLARQQQQQQNRPNLFERILGIGGER